MGRVRRGLLILSCALACAPPAHALDAAQVSSRLAAQVRGGGALSGFYARDLATGRELIAVRPDVVRVPASVEKLFVTSSALLRWGPDGQLQTRVVTDGTVTDGTLDGDLWLVGGGDPTLTEDGLRTLAAAVKTAGVRSVTGGVRADDTQFDRRRGTPRTGFRPDGDLGGRLGALVLRRGFQPDPAAYAAERFSRRLRAAGVKMGRRARVGGAAPEERAVELATLPSPTLATLARATNAPSDNFLAEMLLKALGAQFGGGGSTFSGASVVRDTLDDFGVRPRIVDGSGLSRANRTTPRQVVRLLERMQAQEIAPTWRSSLAVVGRSGTVSRRMRGTPAAGRCAVKTGTIRSVSNLAGVCATPGGDVAFAWLMNGVNVYGARRIQDRLTATLARYEG